MSLLYTIETDESAESLERAVRARIEQGWAPIGGVTVTVHTASVRPVYWLFQAMTKMENEENSR